ncbi:MAG: MFS transporter [Spirochaetota bacterium]
MKRETFTLLIIVLAQFCCTSLWFAGNAVMNDLVFAFQLEPAALGHLTSVVQFGFIMGTLVFALFMLADRFSPSRVFFVSALAGSVCNLGTLWQGNSLQTLLLFRFLVGFALAGIYPVGMKLAADHFEKGLGKSLSFLVGALVLGTAFPHLLKSSFAEGGLPWKSVLSLTSGLACVGGFLIVILVPDGQFRKPSQKLDLSAFFAIFKVRPFRNAAFGYFGHMWELYTFWAFIPVILKTYQDSFPGTSLAIPLLSFAVIAIGSLACVFGGLAATKHGNQRIASLALLGSGLCCLLSPLAFLIPVAAFFVLFLLLWGIFVIADSPLFSALVAENAPPTLKGSALTIVTSIGFSLTIVSIQLLNVLHAFLDHRFLYLVLATGPILGLYAIREKR